jgi:hypothetical protein
MAGGTRAKTELKTAAGTILPFLPANRGEKPLKSPVDDGFSLQLGA